MASTSFHLIPSSSTSPPTLWDVFLSFRGLDTRYSFTDHLYKALQRTGIRTFKDDPELLGGEVISRALPQAIQESKTYIVVLSENYASSPWCLEELEEILDCYKQMKRLVIPVFYYIDPYVVRHQLESFKEAFEKHQSRFDLEKVNRWRLTLNEVAGFSGYHISQNRSQADIVDEVVDRVLLAINPTTLEVAKYPVGLESRVEALSTLLKGEKQGVFRIGIHGMGGVGKTTLAKAVYNEQHKRFQGSCFLSNVGDVSRTEQGQVRLQKQLIVDVLQRNKINIDNVDQGIEVIRARLCSRKVLLVIDDLDDPKPLEVLEGPLASGSITIITTRNEDMLDSIKVQAKYKVNEMDDDQSRQLFAQHAFGDYKIPDKFTELSQDILKRAGGLPLALMVFGSNMFNKPEEEWRWFIDKLNRAPNDNIVKKLVVSFEALKSIDPMLQNIFLDVACFYIGWEKEEVVRIMETCYTYVNHNMDILKKRCLITIDDEDELGMHDLLRDMGREITRNNYPDDPEKHSRLWVSEDIDSVLKNNKGTEAIQGIIYGSHEYEDEEVKFAAESFKRMSRLRFLNLNSVNLTGSFEQTFKDLRWLRWAYCPLICLPSEFYPHKLVILDMRNSENLTTTPDFSRLPCLETLNLAGCWSLKEVHISIGSLVRLVSLDLEHCSNLRSLPDSICSLRALEVLDITYCSKLEELPDQLGKITSLRELRASGATRLKMIPDISQLSNIEYLDLSSCYNLLSIVQLPPNLKHIRAVGCLSMQRLTDLSNLKHLKLLKLNNCNSLTEIPKLPPNLEKIKAKCCVSLVRLPNLSNLKHLEHLNLNNCTSLTEIQGLDELTSLTELILIRCNSSLQTAIFTKHFFQMLCGFPRIIEIYVELDWIEPDWINQSSGYGCVTGSRMSLDLQANESHNILGIIFWFRNYGNGVKYSVKNMASGFTWSSSRYGAFTLCFSRHGSAFVTVPRSILPIRDDCDNNIEIVFSKEVVCAIHLVYETKITTIGEYDCTVANVEDERSNMLLDDFESNKNWLSPGSNIVKVEEDRSHPSKRLKHSECDNWLSL